MKQLLEMATVRGRYVKTDKIDFSFYFSDKTECNHAIRVKVKWNPERVSGSLDGYFELHGEYKYVASENAAVNPSTRLINDARKFFKKYKVLFAAVWEMKLEPDDLVDYFRGQIDLIELIDKFENVDPSSQMRLLQVSTVEQLTSIVTDYNIFNMNN